MALVHLRCPVCMTLLSQDRYELNDHEEGEPIMCQNCHEPLKFTFQLPKRAHVRMYYPLVVSLLVLLLSACSGPSFQFSATGETADAAGHDGVPELGDSQAAGGSGASDGMAQGRAGSKGVAEEDAGGGRAGAGGATGGLGGTGGAVVSGTGGEAQKATGGGTSSGGVSGTGGAGTGGVAEACVACTPGSYWVESSPAGCTPRWECARCRLANGMCGVIYNGACSDNHAGAFIACAP